MKKERMEHLGMKTHSIAKKNNNNKRQKISAFTLSATEYEYWCLQYLGREGGEYDDD